MTKQHGQRAVGWCFGATPLLLMACSGCNSFRNGWLDPSVLGNFTETSTMEVRTSLTLEDTPPGIPGATYPLPEDIEVQAIEYPIAPGDTLEVEIHELRERRMPFQAQVYVSNTGYVNLPVVGRVPAWGLTVPEFELAVIAALRERDVLVDPEVTVNPVFLQHATYSIFGIGVSAATNAPLRAGTFPIRRPGLRVLEAINQVGGLNEFVTEVFIFRQDQPAWQGVGDGAVFDVDAPGQDVATSPAAEPAAAATADAETDPTVAPDEVPDAVREAELIEAVLQHEAAQTVSDEPPDEAARDEKETPSGDGGPMDPFIYVDGQFVRNPAFTPPVEEPAADAPSMETGVPAVNWDRIAGDTSYRVIRVPAEQLRSGDMHVNVVIRGGDVIRIVTGEIGVYYVMGQVNRVGPFGFNSEEITLKGAIAAAGGLTGLAWPDRCTVYRRVGQREQMIQVDLDRIFAGKEPDFVVRRGDIINVGTHPFAPFLRAIRSATIPTPSTNVGYSFIYSRNFADIDSFAARRNPHNEQDQFPGLFP